MAYVLLTSSANPGDRPYAHDELDRMKSAAGADKFGVHNVTDDPDEADIILFLENCSTIEHFSEVKTHSFYQTHPDKCFLFSRHDYPLPLLPGIYASLEKRWYDRRRVRAGGYLRAFDHDFIQYDPDHKSRDFLYSFIGKANTHPVRRKIMALMAPDQYLKDTAPFWPYGELSDEQRRKMENQYRDVCLRSKFILCPRGRGTSSIRLFECLRMGRAPVIISDQWVAPEGPAWSEFSIRVPENEALNIPSILKDRGNEAVAMGSRARDAWEDWFSIEASFHRTTEWCLDIIASRTKSDLILRWSILPQLVQPTHAKALIRYAAGSYKERIMS